MKRLICNIIVSTLICLSGILTAQTSTKITNGPWGNGTNWTSGVPTSSTNAILSTSTTNVNSDGVCNNLIILSNSNLNITGERVLAVNGNLDFGLASNLSFSGGSLIVNGNVLISSLQRLEVSSSLTFYSKIDIGQ